MTNRIFLIRHGNTFWENETPTQVGLKTNLPLTTKGLEQAKNLASYFKKQNITPHAIFCGNLTRQLETANIIENNFDIKNGIHQSNAFNEIDYGLWENLTVDEIIKTWPNEHKQWVEQAKWPNNIFKGEETHHLQLLSQWLQNFNNKKYDNKNIFVVSSQGIIRYFLSIYDHKLFDHTRETKSFINYKVGTGCFCEFESINGVLNLISWNKKPE